MRVTSLVPGVLVLLVGLSSARADANGDHDKAVALFDEARKLIDDGNCDAAMPKLEQSLRYEPSVGARLSTADCTESHNPLEAWTELREAQRLAYLKHDDRVKVAQDRAAALEVRLPLVHVVVPPLVLQEPGLELRLDGALVDRFFYAEGVLAMKEGPHVVDASTPAARWSQQVVASAGATTSVTVHLQAPLASPTPATPARPVTDSPGEAVGAQRTIALILGGVGLGTLVGGAVLGGAALVKKGDIDSACGGDPTVCTVPQGSLDAQRAQQQNYAHFSTLGFVVGGVALASGVVLYLTAPHSRTPVSLTAAGDPSGASLHLLGRF